MGLLYDDPPSAPPETTETPGAPAEEQAEEIKGNEPVEKTEEQEAIPESTENGTEVEGGSGEEDSTSTAHDAQKSEEKPPEPPKTFKIGDKEIEVEKAVKALEAYEKSQKNISIAENTLKFIGDKPRDAFLTIFSGKLGSKEKALEAWNKICEEQVVENWKRANESDEDRKKRELDEREATIKEQEAHALQRQKAAQAEAVRAKYVPMIQAGLKKAGLDSENEYLIRKTADAWSRALEGGGDEPSVDEAVALMLDELDPLLEARLKTQSEEWILGRRPELKDKIIQQSIQNVKQAKATPKTAPQPEEKQPRRTGPKVISQGEFRKMFS